MKLIYFDGWILLSWILCQTGPTLNLLVGFFDWTQIGWAFAGATSYVLWEVTRTPPIHRNGWQRFFLVVIGFFFALALNKVFQLFKPSWPLDSITYISGAFGYKLFTFGQTTKASTIARQITKKIEDSEGSAKSDE